MPTKNKVKEWIVRHVFGSVYLRDKLPVLQGWDMKKEATHESSSTLYHSRKIKYEVRFGIDFFEDPEISIEAIEYNKGKVAAAFLNHLYGDLLLLVHDLREAVYEKGQREILDAMAKIEDMVVYRVGDEDDRLPWQKQDKKGRNPW